MQPSGTAPGAGNEIKKEEASSTPPVQVATQVENRLPTGWQPVAPPEKTVSVQTPKENIPKPPAAEEKPSNGWQSASPEDLMPVQTFTETFSQSSAMEEKPSSVRQQPEVPQEEPKPVQRPAENISQSPAIEKKPSSGWQSASPEDLMPVQTFTENAPQPPAVEEKPSFEGWHSAAPQEEPKSQLPTENIPQSPAKEKKPSSGWQPVTPPQSSSVEPEEPKPARASVEPIVATPVAAKQKPSPAPKPAKRVVKKPAVSARQGVGKKVIFAIVFVGVIAAVAFFVVNRPAEVANEVAKVKEVAGDIKENVQNVTVLVKEKLEPKPVIPEPSQPLNILPEDTIVRPSNFREIAGTWTGRLRNDKQGPKWTFSFNADNFDVSIKNDSGYWMKGTGVYHWDKGAGGDTLRVTPRWNVLDVDVIKSSVSDDAGKTSLGAFFRYKNDAKLCMSRPGSMVEPTESVNADIQCFDLKKKQ